MLIVSIGGTTVGGATATNRDGPSTMSDSDLHTLIGQLKAEISRLGPGDEEARVRLQALVTDVEQRLGAVEQDDTDAADEGDEDLMERLRETVERFEVEHPRTTGILNNIMVTLGSMGI